MNIVGNKMHKAFPLPGESSHWQYKFPLPVEGVPTARRMEIPLLAVCTTMMKKLSVKEKWQLHYEDGICLAHDSSSNWVLVYAGVSGRRLIGVVGVVKKAAEIVEKVV
nr:hypothetical protein [Tanacetum cinerariifolium]